MRSSISIKELHATTGEVVRRAGAARSPLVITDRGEPVAVLANPTLLKQAKRRRAALSAEFERLVLGGPSTDTQADLDDVRGDR